MDYSNEHAERLSGAECNSKLGAIGDALYVIGGKWRLRIIVALTEGGTRFNELQRMIPGISPRVLSNELKELEINGFLTRNVLADTPVVVEYKLTEYSRTLDPVMGALVEWGEMHRAKIRQDDRKKLEPIAQEVLL
ncbi:winged helix-turn-helix transcriptional regulator [Dyadobacter fanqingshengii]|uniref:Helix-turn-helix transcriptional regulator n=1 Tax=Dyadobacter fanqingshengii TaxID=2906443 RepID=A0A9X1PCL3_9BACT|nr:helix-turn-helix domain-containing protein [Dyadobacter fanqingshengii]MCF0041714.1 helix-turn-helix transcriptional regulator [Dyadobacter fanqingshengii]MCF2505062.1 helix-turn-helix transcriptional regulator [Dyadobacter fanqingshengii]USJ36572.1 helix-turn-helix transcriptional regulator [Dyadobacter fanqingshengii]